MEKSINRMAQKRKKNKKFKIFLLFFIFIIFFLMNKDFRYKILPRDSKKTLQAVQKFPVKSEEKIKFFYDIIIKWDDKVIKALNKDGTSKWEKEINFNKPIVSFGEDTIYLCDKDTGDIFFLDLEGKSFKRVQMKKPIKSISEKDELIFTIVKDGEMESIVIMDKQGIISNKVPFKDERILNFSSDKDRAKFVLSILSIEDGDLSTKLAFYETKGKHMSSIKFKDEIITYVQFVNKNSVLVFTDNKIYFIKDEKIQWERELNYLKDMYVDMEKGKVYILMSDMFKIISYENEIEESIKLEKNYKKVIPFGKQILLVGENEIVGINKGRKFLEYKSQEKIEEVFVLNSDIVLITPDNINIMVMKKNNDKAW